MPPDALQTSYNFSELIKSQQKQLHIACKNCRRSKVKCVYADSLPCETCVLTKRQDTCILPEKGTSSIDRTPRGLRKRRKPTNEERAQMASHSRDVASTSEVPIQGTDAPAPAPTNAVWPAIQTKVSDEYPSYFPPQPLLIEGCQAFFDRYFQLSFIHPPSFMLQVHTSPSTLDAFLVLSMLCISCRFCTSLVHFYGGGDLAKATDTAQNLASAQMYIKIASPGLETVQGLTLLALSEWSQGQGLRARMLHGLAIQISNLLRIGTDDTNLTAIEIECRRRTRWYLNVRAMTIHQSYLSSEFKTPSEEESAQVPLPTHNPDFLFGQIGETSYWTSTENFLETNAGFKGGASMFSLMVLIMACWGKAVQYLGGAGDIPTGEQQQQVRHLMDPWKPTSLVSLTEKDLDVWNKACGQRYAWSIENLMAHKMDNKDMAYIGMWLDYSVIKIAIRRPYLPVFIQVLSPNRFEPIGERYLPPGGVQYWRDMAREMIEYAFFVIDITAASTMIRPLHEGCTFLHGYSIYLASTILNYVRCCPWICPDHNRDTTKIVQESISRLDDIALYWPIAVRWSKSLKALSTMSWPETTAQVVHFDIDLDKPEGIYRQYASPESKITDHVLKSEQLLKSQFLKQYRPESNMMDPNPNTAVPNNMEGIMTDLTLPYPTEPAPIPIPAAPLPPISSVNGDIRIAQISPGTFFEGELQQFLAGNAGTGFNDYFGTL